MALTTLCSLLLLTFASLPQQPAAAPTPINEAPPGLSPAQSDLLLQDLNTILSSPRFNASDASAWPLLFINWATRTNKRYSSKPVEQQA